MQTDSSISSHVNLFSFDAAAVPEQDLWGTRTYQLAGNENYNNADGLSTSLRMLQTAVVDNMVHVDAPLLSQIHVFETQLQDDSFQTQRDVAGATMSRIAMQLELLQDEFQRKRMTDYASGTLVNKHLPPGFLELQLHVLKHENERKRLGLSWFDPSSLFDTQRLSSSEIPYYSLQGGLVDACMMLREPCSEKSKRLHSAMPSSHLSSLEADGRIRRLCRIFLLQQYSRKARSNKLISTNMSKIDIPPPLAKWYAIYSQPICNRSICWDLLPDHQHPTSTFIDPCVEQPKGSPSLGKWFSKYKEQMYPDQTKKTPEIMSRVDQKHRNQHIHFGRLAGYHRASWKEDELYKQIETMNKPDFHNLTSEQREQKAWYIIRRTLHTLHNVRSQMNVEYQQTLKYIYRSETLSCGTRNTKSLLSYLGYSFKQTKIIRILGTQGKSTVAMKIAAGLKSAGFKVGVYSSPHLTTIRERITINGHSITKSEMIYLTTLIRDAAQACECYPAFFEILTVMAVCHFVKHQCDFCILESGGAGTLDPTNSISPNLVSCTVLTSLSSPILYKHSNSSDIYQILQHFIFFVQRTNSMVVCGPAASPYFPYIKKIAPTLSKRILLLGQAPRENVNRENSRIAESVLSSLGLPIFQTHIAAASACSPLFRFQCLTNRERQLAARHIHYYLQFAYNVARALHIQMRLLAIRYPELFIQLYKTKNGLQFFSFKKNKWEWVRFQRSLLKYLRQDYHFQSTTSKNPQTNTSNYDLKKIKNNKNRKDSTFSTHESDLRIVSENSNNFSIGNAQNNISSHCSWRQNRDSMLLYVSQMSPKDMGDLWDNNHATAKQAYTNLLEGATLFLTEGTQPVEQWPVYYSDNLPFNNWIHSYRKWTHDEKKRRLIKINRQQVHFLSMVNSIARRVAKMSLTTSFHKFSAYNNESLYWTFNNIIKLRKNESFSIRRPDFFYDKNPSSATTSKDFGSLASVANVVSATIKAKIRQKNWLARRLRKSHFILPTPKAVIIDLCQSETSFARCFSELKNMYPGNSVRMCLALDKTVSLEVLNSATQVLNSKGLDPTSSPNLIAGIHFLELDHWKSKQMSDVLDELLTNSLINIELRNRMIQSFLTQLHWQLCVAPPIALLPISLITLLRDVLISGKISNKKLSSQQFKNKIACKNFIAQFRNVYGTNPHLSTDAILNQFLEWAKDNPQYRKIVPKLQQMFGGFSRQKHNKLNKNIPFLVTYKPKDTAILLKRMRQITEDLYFSNKRNTFHGDNDWENVDFIQTRNLKLKKKRRTTIYNCCKTHSFTQWKNELSGYRFRKEDKQHVSRMISWKTLMSGQQLHQTNYYKKFTDIITQNLSHTICSSSNIDPLNEQKRVNFSNNYHYQHLNDDVQIQSLSSSLEVIDKKRVHNTLSYDNEILFKRQNFIPIDIWEPPHLFKNLNNTGGKIIPSAFTQNQTPWSHRSTPIHNCLEEKNKLASCESLFSNKNKRDIMEKSSKEKLSTTDLHLTQIMFPSSNMYYIRNKKDKLMNDLSESNKLKQTTQTSFNKNISTEHNDIITHNQPFTQFPACPRVETMLPEWTKEPTKIVDTHIRIEKYDFFNNLKNVHQLDGKILLHPELNEGIFLTLPSLKVAFSPHIYHTLLQQWGVSKTNASFIFIPCQHFCYAVIKELWGVIIQRCKKTLPKYYFRKKLFIQKLKTNHMHRMTDIELTHLNNTSKYSTQPISTISRILYAWRSCPTLHFSPWRIQWLLNDLKMTVEQTLKTFFLTQLQDGSQTTINKDSTYCSQQPALKQKYFPIESTQQNIKKNVSPPVFKKKIQKQHLQAFSDLFSELKNTIHKKNNLYNSSDLGKPINFESKLNVKALNHLVQIRKIEKQKGITCSIFQPGDFQTQLSLAFQMAASEKSILLICGSPIMGKELFETFGLGLPGSKVDPLVVPIPHKVTADTLRGDAPFETSFPEGYLTVSPGSLARDAANAYLPQAYRIRKENELVRLSELLQYRKEKQYNV